MNELFFGLAVYELLYNEEVPDRVVMNEAIELCKTFGDEKSGRFVNGVYQNSQKNNKPDWRMNNGRQNN